MTSAFTSVDPPQNCPLNWPELLQFLSERLKSIYGHQIDIPIELPLLNRVLSDIENAYTELIPFIWNFAHAPYPEISSLRDVHTIQLRQSETLAILARSFFCLYNRDSYDWHTYPSINFDRLYDQTLGYNGQEYAKLCMIMEYFQRLQKRHTSDSKALGQRRVTFQLLACEATWKSWEHCERPLLTFTTHPLQESIDEAKRDLRIDFANAYLGGASLSYGSVQEEIMFALHPEMNAGRLFTPRLKSSEAVILMGFEQFSCAEGYGHSLRFAGPYSDPSPVKDHQLSSYVTAVDALDYRYSSDSFQYGTIAVLRELNKLYAGISAPDLPTTMATGNWGCGVFGGNVELKTLIQWTAASRAGKSIAYYPYDNHIIAEGMPRILEQIHALKISLTVGDMMDFFSEEYTSHIFEEFEKWLTTRV